MRGIYINTTMHVYKTQAYKQISPAWEDLDEEQQVELLCILYEDMTDAQKDEFLRETENQ